MVKIKVRVSSIKESLALVQKTVGKPNAMNGFNSVRLSFKSGEDSSITSGNGSIQTESILRDIDCDGDVDLLVGFVKFFSIVRTLPEDKFLTLTIADGKMKTACGKSRSIMAIMPADSYPLMVSNPERSAEVPEGIAVALNKVSYAAAKDHATMKQINGVTLMGADGKLDIMATDAFLVGAYVMDSDLVGSAIIPHASMSIFSGLLANATLIGIDGAHVKLVGEGFNAIFRLIDGKAFIAKNIIPKSDKAIANIEFSKENILDSLSRVLAVVEDSVKGYCTLELKSGEQESVLTGIERNSTNTVVEVLPVSHSGQDVICTFNPRFLMSMLSSIDDDSVKLEVHAARGEPMVFNDENMSLLMTQIKI